MIVCDTLKHTGTHKLKVAHKNRNAQWCELFNIELNIWTTDFNIIHIKQNN